MLGKIQVSLVGSRKSIDCIVRLDIVDLMPAVQAFKLSLHGNPCARLKAHLVNSDGCHSAIVLESAHPPTALFEPMWRSSRLVIEDPGHRRDRADYKDVPHALQSVNVDALIKRGIPATVAEGFRASWDEAAQCKPALHRHNLIFEYLYQCKNAPHTPAAQTAKIDLREFLACPSGDTKRMGKELKMYTLSPSDDRVLLRRLTDYPSGGGSSTRWVTALQGAPEDVAETLWVDHSQKQFHPGQRYAAANVKDYYLPGVVKFAVDIVKNCPDCAV